MGDYYNQGWEAYEAEQSTGDNPYTDSSLEGQEWSLGYAHAQAFFEPEQQEF